MSSERTIVGTVIAFFQRKPHLRVQIVFKSVKTNV